MRIIITALCLLLAGCATTHPVLVGCHVNLPPEPHYPYQDLTMSDSHNYGKVVKSYEASLQLALDYIKLLKKYHKACE